MHLGEKIKAAFADAYTLRVDKMKQSHMYDTGSELLNLHFE